MNPKSINNSREDRKNHKMFSASQPDFNGSFRPKPTLRFCLSSSQVKDFIHQSTTLQKTESKYSVFSSENRKFISPSGTERVIEKKKKKHSSVKLKFEKFIDDVKKRRSKITDVLETIALFMFKLCRLKIQSFEINARELFIHLIQVMAMISQFAVSVFVFVTPFLIAFDDRDIDGKGYEYQIIIPPLVMIITSSIVNFFFFYSFIFRTKRSYIGHILSFFMDYVFVGSICFASSRDIQTGGFSIIFVLAPLLIISIDGKFKLFWTLSYFMYQFAFLIHQVTHAFMRKTVITIGPVELAMISVGQYIAFTVVAIFVFLFQYFAHINYKTFKENVEKIARAISELNFHTEEIEELIEKPDEVCSTAKLLLKRIVLNVKEYKSYLPQGLIDERFVSSKENSSISEKLSVPTISTRVMSTDSIAHHSDGSSHSSNDSSFFEKHVPQENDAKGASDPDIIKDSLIDYSLQRRTGTFLLIDITGWNKVIESYDSQKMMNYYIRFVEIVHEECIRNRGIILSLINDKVLCCWNVKNIVVNHEYNACLTASLMVKRLIEDRFLPFKAVAKISIVTGTTLVGNMGCSEIKTFNYFGRKINYLYSLNKVCQEENDFCIIIDERTQNKIKYDFRTIFVNTVKCGGKNFNIYMVLERLKKEADEWLYEIGKHLQNSRKKDSFYLSEVLEKRFASGDYDGAYEALNELTLQRKFHVHKELRKNIREEVGFTVLKTK